MKLQFRPQFTLFSSSHNLRDPAGTRRSYAAPDTLAANRIATGMLLRQTTLRTGTITLHKSDWIFRAISQYSPSFRLIYEIPLFSLRQMPVTFRTCVSQWQCMKTVRPCKSSVQRWYLRQDDGSCQQNEFVPRSWRLAAVSPDHRRHVYRSPCRMWPWADYLVTKPTAGLGDHNPNTWITGSNPILYPRCSYCPATCNTSMDQKGHWTSCKSRSRTRFQLQGIK
jgi:hypothetical protein